MYITIKDLIYNHLLGYKHRYYDANGNHIYTKPSPTRKQAADVRKQVRKEFGHLKWLYKKNLRNGKKMKLNLAYFNF